MTQAGFITTEQYEMLQKWETIVRAADLWSKDLHPFSTFLLAKRIMNYERDHGLSVYTMTPAQKTEMKQAINAECSGGV